MNYFILFYVIGTDSGQTYRGRAMKATGSSILFENEIIPLIRGRYLGADLSDGGFSVSVLRVRQTTSAVYEGFFRANEGRAAVAGGFTMGSISLCGPE